MIDTHTHLYAEEFDTDRAEVIAAAIAAGVQRFYLPAIDSNYTQKMKDLQQQYPQNIGLMAGLHPCYVKAETYKEELAAVEQELQNGNYVAVGEIGIDLYWDKTYLKEQQEAFALQIDWAKKYKLPIVIHARESFDEIFEILEQKKDEKLFGIFHCFTGTLEQAQRAISLGMKLGIGGVATFKNGKIDKFLNQIPLRHIVLETDSPYLSPSPYRGKRNESKHTVVVAEKLCTLYQKTLEEIDLQTTENARMIFGDF